MNFALINKCFSGENFCFSPMFQQSYRYRRHCIGYAGLFRQVQLRQITILQTGSAIYAKHSVRCSRCVTLGADSLLRDRGSALGTKAAAGSQRFSAIGAKCLVDGSLKNRLRFRLLLRSPVQTVCWLPRLNKPCTPALRLLRHKIYISSHSCSFCFLFYTNLPLFSYAATLAVFLPLVK